MNFGPNSVSFISAEAKAICLVVAEDPGAVCAHRPALIPAMIAGRGGPWPSLNNTIDRERGFADQILLTDASGLASDYVRYTPGDLDGNGVTLERWIENGLLVAPDGLIPCSSPGGATPGRAGGGESSPAGSSAPG